MKPYLLPRSNSAGLLVVFGVLGGLLIGTRHHQRSKLQPEQVPAAVAVTSNTLSGVTVPRSGSATNLSQAVHLGASPVAPNAAEQAEIDRLTRAWEK